MRVAHAHRLIIVGLPEMRRWQELAPARRQQTGRSGAGRQAGCAGSELSDQAEGDGRERIGGLCDGDNEGTTRATSSCTNSTWAMSGGNEVELPKPAPNNTIPSSSSGTLAPAAAMKTMEPATCTA